MPDIQRKDDYNLDTNESAIFSRQLEFVKSNTYDIKYKNLKATTLLPVSTEAPSGAKFITYRQYGQVGIAKIVSDYANDFPRVDIFGKEVQANVRSIGASYGYSIDEIRAAQMAGLNLEQRRANAARRASDEKVDKIAWEGDTENGLQGFINFPGITEYTVAAGASTFKTWISKTPDEIVADVTGMVDAIVEPTKGREAPDTLLLPMSQYLLISNKRMTDGNTMTVLQYILKNNAFISTIEWVVELKEAGDSGTDRMMAYARDSEHLTLEIPQPFEQFAPQQKGMEFIIPCHQKTGGVIVYYPLSIAYGDGI